MKALAVSSVVAVLLFAALASPVRKSWTPPPGKHVGPREAEALQPPLRDTRRSLDALYMSTDVPKSIPDGPGGVATSVLTISDAVQVEDLNVRLQIEHTWVRDLCVTLIAPGDTIECVLLDLLPRDDAVNLDGTFDDEAGVSIMEVDTPLIGVWRPLDSLSAFDGLSAQGTWTLRVLDRFRLDSGRVVAWGIDVNPEISLEGTVRNSRTNVPVGGALVAIVEGGQLGMTNGSGHYEITGMAAGDYHVRFSKTGYDTLILPVTIVQGVTSTLDAALATRPPYYEFMSTAAAVSIPDTGTATMSLQIGEQHTIADLDVTVNITHSWVGDLDVYLVSPDTHMVHLIAFDRNNDGEDFINCRFDDEAARPITEGSAPYTGSFRPVQELRAFDGRALMGEWKLIAADRDSLASGSIRNFILHITTTPEDIAGPDMAEPAREFHLEPAYPNPFNSSTTLRYSVSRVMPVTLTIYDVMGREVACLADGVMSAGVHVVVWDASGVASGIYLAHLSAGRHTTATKIVLLK